MVVKLSKAIFRWFAVRRGINRIRPTISGVGGVRKGRGGASQREEGFMSADLDVSQASTNFENVLGYLLGGVDGKRFVSILSRLLVSSL
jgi:hypothetical protein